MLPPSPKWLALYLQARRRKRLAADTSSAPAPVIDSGWFIWGDTDFGFVDNFISIAFDQAAVPLATFEIWETDSNNLWHIIDVVSSGTDEYAHRRISEDADTFSYKVRYVNGPTIGPFSNTYDIVVTPPPP
jgi:hypothetical protein